MLNKNEFKAITQEFVESCMKTLIEKNAKYAPENDALHNFRVGANIDGSTVQETIWHYMKKHMVALLDKIDHDDWSDMDDVREKIGDMFNYLIFMWAATIEQYKE